MPFGIKIIQQNNQGLVETLGKYSHGVEAGLHFYIPGIQKIRVVNLAMKPLLLEKYSIITKDNADIAASVTLNYHVTDAAKYQYENTDSEESMVQLVRGHLRDIIGRMEWGLHKKINKELAESIGDLTNNYGINVDRINIDELTPSAEIQRAMDKQLTAEREKTAAIARAEGEAKSIQLTTDAQNEALQKTAIAEAEATKSRADAEKYRIDTIQSGLANATTEYFKNQSINAFETLSKSDTNLVVIPSDKIDSLGSIPVVGEMLKENDK